MFLPISCSVQSMQTFKMSQVNVHGWKHADIITLATVRFHIVTSCPDLSRLLTMAEPMVPRPRNPIFSDVATTRFDQMLSDVAGNMSGMNCI